MRERLAILTALCVLTAAAARAPGQPAPPREIVEEALRRLGSDDAKDHAWGAHLTGLHRVTRAIPSCVAVLRLEASRQPEDRDAGVVAAALDALVVTRAVVPPDVLMPHAEGDHLAAVIVLLSRAGADGTRGLMTIWESLDRSGETSLAWLGCGNLLAERRAPGFAERILARLEIPVSVIVGRSHRGRVPIIAPLPPPPPRLPGPPVPAAVEGYPPHVRHDLLLAIDPVEILRARGVSSLRLVGPSKGRPRSRLPDPDVCRLCWLTLLSGGRRDMAVTQRRLRRMRAYRNVKLTWGGRPPYLRTVGRHLERLHGEVGAILGRLVDLGLLDRGTAAGHRLRCRFDVKDGRYAKRAPLPRPPVPAGPPWREDRRPRGEEIDT